ncbi:MAG: acyl-CoA synthetase FdrA [Candidatus Rokubacteria bacterium]|nr:acyl-CoA synthetase FdrA [Candidatus Rokubacteria bacterium]
MPVRAVVRSAFYQDSVALMRVAQELRARPGVREAAALMGTPANHELLAAAGLATAETKAAGPGDLVLAVDAETDAAVDAALAAADGLFAARRQALEAAVRVLPRTLDSALRHLPEANLVAISVPGAYAAAEAMRALRRGLHVFLFSDNVPLADEVALKREAIRRRLLCMGPDCGTAYVGGIGLGFANVVPPGRVGVVAASGTGLQAVAVHLAGLGEGLSHGIGVGGRDLSAEVGGLMTTVALEALGRDPATALVVLVSKPPDPVVLPAIETALAALSKPAVVCCLGAPPREGPGRWVATLEDAAEAAVAMLRGRAWRPRAFADPTRVRARLAALGPHPGAILALYTGGTLAHEAALLLQPLLGPERFRVLDLGADELTVGRPHPMLDPDGRAARVREAGRDPAVGVVLVDVVLGRAAHPDPAAPLAAAIRDARTAAEAAGRSLAVVASVVGTKDDPQDFDRQVAALDAGGAEVLPSNAQAARFAALLLRPDLAPSLLGESP